METMEQDNKERREKVLLKIGELVAFFHISVKAIRLYEKKGIIMPAWVDPDSGYRYYNVNHIHQLNTLIELKSMGFSLNEIKPIMEGKSSSAELAIDTYIII